MDKAKVIDKFNEAIGLELAALIQYNQYSHVVMGADRRLWEEFFHDASDEALSHVRKFAERVVALGGIPCTEPEDVKQASEVQEMLQNSLAVEQRAVEIYTEALALVQDHAAYRNLVEDHIQTETEDVEELQKYLNQVEKVSAGSSRSTRKKSA